jgi:hypothetical protein
MEIGLKFKSFEAKYKRVRPVSLTIGITLISGGVTILSPNIYEYIVGEIIGMKELAYSALHGWTMILIGILISLLGAHLTTLRKRRIESDTKFFYEMNSMLDETELDNIFYDLLNENAIYKKSNTVLNEYYFGISKPQFFFQTTSIQYLFMDYMNDIQRLISFMSKNFYELSSHTGGNTRLHLKPDWNIDYSDYVSPSDQILYDKLSDDKDKLVKKVKSSYAELRRKIKKELAI